MKKLLLVPALLVSLLASLSAHAVEGVVVIDMRTAMLATQVSSATLKAMQEESVFAGNMEEAKMLQTDSQALVDKLQKDGETLSQEEIAQMQRDIQTKSKDLEFMVGKIQAKQNETIEKILRDLSQLTNQIVQDLITSKDIKVILDKSQIMYADAALDLTVTVTNMLDVKLAEAAADKK
jgi:Skp family chaperone for outer membrane proteins